MKASLSACALALICLSAPLTTIAAIRYVNVNCTNPAPPYTNWATAATVIQDAVDAASTGDEVVVTNGVYETGGHSVHGTITNRVAVTKPLTLRSANGPEATVIRGRQVPGTTNGDGAVRCVYLTNGAALVGFTLTNGATLSLANTHELISGGGVWCESSGAWLSNCVLVCNAAEYGGGAFGGTLNNCGLDMNWARVGGGGAVRSTLNGCALKGNLAGRFGGGTENAQLNDCILRENSAYTGGGAAAGYLNRCVIATNSAVEGGGTAGAMLSNCLLTGNSAQVGGGLYGGSGMNCTIAGNSAAEFGGGAYFLPYNPEDGWCPDYACWPYPECHACVIYPFGELVNCIVYYNNAPGGVENTTNAPFFVDAAAGDFRLQSNSPCINAGRNSYAPSGSDLDRNPRIAGGTVDIGAYEFQSPQSTLSYAWLQQYGLPTDGSADLADPDGDGHNNSQEWRASTDPTDATSVLRLLTPVRSTNGLLVSWQSVSGRTYFVERSTNLAWQTPFTPSTIAVYGRSGTTTYLDTNGVGTGPFFYRVNVQE